MTDTIGPFLGFIFLLLFGPLIGAIGGSWVGLVVGWGFPETSDLWLTYFGLSGVSMWQAGALLGFVGSFLRMGVK